MSYVYILKSKKNFKYYTGFTVDLTTRLNDHNKGRGSIFTKLHLPWELVCYKLCSNISEARLLEKKVKSYKSGNQFKKILNGDVAEWLKAPVSKTGIGATRS